MIGYTIVGGFLGAGKTSLINGVLAGATERIAVVVNDLGDISLDARLLRRAEPTASGGSVVELANGCVCCTIGDGLAVTLRDLCGRTPTPDRIIVECSGVAEPARVAAYGSRRVLEDPTVVVVVDATDVRQRASDGRFAHLVRAQLASADLLVISKGDLVPAVEVDDLRAWLDARQPGTPVVLGHPADLGRALPHRIPLPATPPVELAVNAETLTPPAELSAKDLRILLDADAGLIRAKGVVSMADGPTLVQWAAGRLDVAPWPHPVDTYWLTVIRSG